jgi:hypothetical protein
MAEHDVFPGEATQRAPIHPGLVLGSASPKRIESCTSQSRSFCVADYAYDCESINYLIGLMGSQSFSASSSTCSVERLWAS